MRTRGQRAIILFVLVALAAALAASCNERGKSRQSFPAAVVLPASTARALPPLPNRPLSAEARVLREQAMADAARGRGLSWLGEVGMAELSGWEYGTRTKAVAEALGGEDLRALGRLAAAGGVLPENIDLATLAASFVAASASAHYSPLDKHVLLMTGQRRSRFVLAHEFTHALQDQHFDLLSLLLVRPYSFDRAEALFAVIEGDALNVQRRLEMGDALWSRRPLEEITQQEDQSFGAYRAELGSLFPPLLTETFLFRYRDGARFVETVRRARGQQGVDDLFRNPPASSEQVLHPEKYLSGAQADPPREISLNESAFTAGGWRAATSTPFGEIGVRGVLLAGLGQREAARAAAGWGGDRAYLFENEAGAPLFVWQTVWDSHAEAAEFLRAYAALQEQRRSEPVAGASAVGGQEMAWREAGRFLLIRRDGDAVTIARGAEADARFAVAATRP